jgi:hypothetical protein
VIKNKPLTRPRTLELNRETIVHLTREQLENVAGGSDVNSLHPSQCITWCAGSQQDNEVS